MKLNKWAVALGSLLLAGSSATAQTTSVGVFGGISIPKLESADDNVFSKGYASRSDATFGVFADFGISKHFSIKTAISYSGQGGIREGVQPIPSEALPAGIPLPPVQLFADFSNEAILKYLEIPVLAKLEWGNKFRYFVNAGPYIGFLMSAKQQTDGNSGLYLDESGSAAIPGVPSISFTKETDVKDNLNTVNVGLTAGGGLKYVLAERHELILDARAAYGLTHLQKDTEANGKTKTGGVFVSLGYGFRLGGAAK